MTAQPYTTQEKHDPDNDRLITRDVALIMLATFFAMSVSMIATPIVAGYAQSLGAHGIIMGLVAGALSLSALFCRPIAGNLSDRTNKRTLALIGSVIYIIANLWYAFSPNASWLLVARIFNGIGFACITVCLSSWLSMLLPLHRMGAGMGLYGTMNALAQAFGPDIGIRVSQTLGYRTTFYIATVLSVLIAITVLFIKDSGNPLSQRTTTRAHGIRALFEPRAIPIAFIFMMFGIPYFANQSFIVEYGQALHLNFGVSIFFPIYAIVLLFLRIVLRNWFDSRSFFFFMILCTIADFGMIASFTFMHNVWLLILAAACTAFGYGLMSSVTQARAVLIAGRERSGMANTTYYAGIDLGMFLGPLIGGALYAGIPIQWFYPALLVTMPIAWIVYAAFHKTINPQRD